jgi:cell wall-active antibiotic response 4TMS protein YvqF
MAASFSIERVILGFALLALGVLWMLANAGRLDLLSTLRTWWPSLLVLWGALELVQAFVLRSRGVNPRSLSELGGPRVPPDLPGGS